MSFFSLRHKLSRQRRALQREFASRVTTGEKAHRFTLKVPVLGTVFRATASGDRVFSLPSEFKMRKDSEACQPITLTHGIGVRPDDVRNEMAFRAAVTVVKSGRADHVLEALQI